MIDILAKWNRWGHAALEGGIVRNVTEKLKPFLHTPEVVVLMGPRRAGKTTVLFQMMDLLKAQGVPEQAFLHINFEEPAYATQLNLGLLDQLYDTYRESIYPKGKAYLFLDEIQNVPEWERWIRARNETEEIKLFITGSSSKLLSRELGTLLTGRHVSFSVLPLSFDEYLRFKSIPLPKKLLPIKPKPEMTYALNDFIQWGGFPEIVLAQEPLRKEMLLRQYFDDVLFKDVVMRHAIRDVAMLRNLAVHLLTHTGTLVSFQRISKLFNVSPELAGSYCQYLQEAFLVDFFPFYSMKVAERNRNPQKIHAIDLGLRRIANLSQAPDKGRLIETTVYHKLLQTVNDGIFYWKQENEIDFLIRQGNTIVSLLQVVYEGLEQMEVQDREYAGLLAAMKKFPKANAMIVTFHLPKNRPPSVKKFEVIPLWFFLLEGVGL